MEGGLFFCAMLRVLETIPVVSYLMFGLEWSFFSQWVLHGLAEVFSMPVIGLTVGCVLCNAWCVLRFAEFSFELLAAVCGR